jgi:hypothetical protein
VSSSASIYNEDNPSWDAVTKGLFEAEYWQATHVELNTLVNKLRFWDLVSQLLHMNDDLPSTWAFKIKRFPDGTVKKFKAQFSRDDHQREGINFFETWAPVVQWSTIQIVGACCETRSSVSSV